MILGSLTLIAHQGNSLNVIAWTLFYEMWLSLLFPMFLYLLFKVYKVVGVLCIIRIAFLSYWLWTKNMLLENDWAAIIYYSWYFIFGMIIYQYKDRCISVANIYFLIIGLALYFINYVFYGKITSRLEHEMLIALGKWLDNY